jgi:hypothetical protein
VVGDAVGFAVGVTVGFAVGILVGFAVGVGVGHCGVGATAIFIERRVTP